MSSVVISGDTSGAITVSAPLVAGTNTLTLQAGTGIVSMNTLETAKAYNWNGLTTNTSLDFTALPSWVKRITVMFAGVSFNANANPMIQIGAGSVSITGYTSAAGDYVPTANFANSAIGFILSGTTSSIGNAGNNMYGQIVITNVTGNLWCSASNLSAFGTSTVTATGAGTITLGGSLDRVRITSLAGTSTFDAGSVNILYEG